MKKKQNKEEVYKKYVEQKTPSNQVGKNMVKAFVVGGGICVFGEFLLNRYQAMGMSIEESSVWTAIILILISAVLTGFNLYSKLANWGGAGALVPITGFANSVAAPAIEYKKEGQVLGVGCKIFTIAGPVILYGIFTSWILGIIYYICKMVGVL